MAVFGFARDVRRVLIAIIALQFVIIAGLAYQTMALANVDSPSAYDIASEINGTVDVDTGRLERLVEEARDEASNAAASADEAARAARSIYVPLSPRCSY